MLFYRCSRILVLVAVLRIGPAFGTPTVDPFTTTVNLQEDTTAATALADINCTPTPRTSCICNLRSTFPVNGPFDVWKRSTDLVYKVYFVGTSQATTALDYSKVHSYLVDVTCRDNTGSTSAIQTLEVDIEPNQQPVVTNYPAVTLSSVDASTTVSGTTIYALTVTDPEKDAITYTMTQDPDYGYFSIGKSDGIIRTTVDLRTAITDRVVCKVTVLDRKNTLSPFSITIPLINLNVRPIISNLPASINVSETKTTDFVLTTLTFSDPDTFGNTLQPECSVEPVAENYKFTYETGTRRLKLNAVNAGETLLDYETTNKYLITCWVYDGYLYSQGDVLTVYVDNVNEPPVFTETTYYCKMAESAAGISSCNLGVTVTDPELNNIPTIALTGNNSDRFRYDKSTSKLTFSVNYDVDKNNMSTHALITIYAVDSNRATGTAQIDITIEDANDNTCEFGSSTAAQFTLDQGTGLKTLGTFVATDADLTSPNNAVTFQIVSAIPTSSTNYITVFGNGEIKYIGLIPESAHGTSYSLVIRCKDGGTPSNSATATVQVSYLTTTSTTMSTTTSTTTTTTASTTTQKASTSVWDDSAFVAVFATLMALLGLGLAIVLWYFFCRGSNPCSGGPQYERQAKVRPVPEYEGDDYFQTHEPRTSLDYRDHAWRTGR